MKGDPRWSSWADRRHNGTLHGFLHPQWHRDSLLPRQVLLLIEIEKDGVSKEGRKSSDALSFEQYLYVDVYRFISVLLCKGQSYYSQCCLYVTNTILFAFF